MKKKLRLYVWENVLTDYSDGIMFALATSEDHARKLLLKKSSGSSGVENDSKRKPKVISKPEGFLVWGGG